VIDPLKCTIINSYHDHHTNDQRRLVSKTLLKHTTAPDLRATHTIIIIQLIQRRYLNAPTLNYVQKYLPGKKKRKTIQISVLTHH